MANKTHLFLLGGTPAYKVYADEFVAAAGGRNAVMVVLAQTRVGWERYKVEITQPWIDREVSRYVPVTPDEDGVLDKESASLVLQNATGILICGGNTPTYHKLFASEPLRSIIRQKHQAGVPVAGISAGALISLEICQLTPNETKEDELRIVQGLSLAQDFVIGVHFTEWTALPEVLEVMSKTKTKIGFGIDEPACVVCEDGKFARVLGQSVFQIDMTDFDKQAHRVTRL
jgi:cyanophycinase